jgi:lipid II isoglutaminyl synthase (glutamine-hydrolysing)
MIRLAAGVAAAKAVGTLARSAGRGGGTSLPGKVLTRVEPHAIARLASHLDRGSVVISATNGKTTTAAMVASILERTGVRLVHNRAGANMAGGIASALADASRRGGRTLTGDLGLFEVDEFWLGPVVEELEPRAMLLGNLFRDQLDRYGELETIADRWAAVVASRAGRTALVLNADDPLVADLGRPADAAHSAATGAVPPAGAAGAAAPAAGTPRAGAAGPAIAPVYFGVDDDSLALPELQHASDSKHCRNCGHAYAYEAIYLAHLGRYACPQCGRRRPEPAVTATDVALRGIRSAAFALHAGGETRRVELPLPGLYNVYNALGAAALTLSLGVSPADVAAGLERVAPAFGRAETLDLGGRPASILLVKNPAGANEVLRTLALEGGELDLLGVLNDRVADGRDVSWVWDADWELLVPHIRRITCSGTRAAELALRMKYAGLPLDRIAVVGGLEAGLDAALGAGEGPLYVVPTYTALLELQELLTRRGLSRAYWR